MADYISIDSKIDSNSLGNYSTFQPSAKTKLDVVFQPDSSNGYYSVLALNTMGGDGIGYDLSDEQDMSGQTQESGQEQNDKKQEKPIYSIGSNPMNGLFIGSVTVLGLFVLYRLLQK